MVAWTVVFCTLPYSTGVIQASSVQGFPSPSTRLKSSLCSPLPLYPRFDQCDCACLLEFSCVLGQYPTTLLSYPSRPVGSFDRSIPMISDVRDSPWPMVPIRTLSSTSSLDVTQSSSGCPDAMPTSSLCMLIASCHHTADLWSRSLSSVSAMNLTPDCHLLRIDIPVLRKFWTRIPLIQHLARVALYLCGFSDQRRNTL